ncbi:MAG: nicotinamide mononucleotide transporter [Ruminococcaceae bacterium]|nr:nicotinamide mononucleotide transporter [Oscillospiraceae bacterium]
MYRRMLLLLEVKMSLLYNPFSKLSKFEYLLWFLSLTIVGGGFIISGSRDYLTLTASLIGVTALILVAKGDSWGQILTALFALIYAVISWDLRYYGEMITYVGMSAPIAVMSVVEWVRHPYKHTTEVEVSVITKKKAAKIIVLTAVVTFMFYFILSTLGTSNLMVSTLSVATSFSASYLMLCRSPYYALAYAANDVVLIVLWVLASTNDTRYIPMVLCFLMFLANDTYGFINWMRMRIRQTAGEIK